MLEVVEAADLQARTGGALARVQEALAVAFGHAGPGILVVRGLPDWYAPTRAALLESARAFASMPPERRAAYECAAADYAVGWSCGRERFRGKVDSMKGSFYANPCFDDPAAGDAARAAAHKHLLSPNVWPAGDDGARVGMEVPFKKLGRYIDAVGRDLAWHCDRYVESATGDAPFTALHDALESSRAQKGRLLHYFPAAASSETGAEATPADGASDLWCGFHNDHGCLTGLVAGEYYDTLHNRVLPTAPDAGCGLHVAPRGGAATTRVGFAADELAFQTGEAAQLLSGGVLAATAHGVRAARAPHVARSALAVFLQPDPDAPLAAPRWADDAATASSPLVPPLARRFVAGDSFAAFATKSIQAYVVADAV